MGGTEFSTAVRAAIEPELTIDSKLSLASKATMLLQRLSAVPASAFAVRAA